MLELLQLVSIAILLILSFIYSGSEVALFSIPEFEHRRLSHQKDRNLKTLLHYLQKPQQALITILIGNVVVNSGASIIGEHVSKSFFTSNSLFYSVFIMTFLLLLFGEIVPKNVAVTRPITFSRTFIPVINLTNRIFFPVQFLVQLVVKRSSGFKKKHYLSKEELLSAVGSGTDAGIPSTSISALTNLIHKDIRHNLTRPLFVPETKHVLPLLSEFKRNHIYLAIVLDEFGGTSGIVTLKDILDAIFIRDILLAQLIQKKSDDRWYIQGDTKISDVNSTLDLSLPVDSNTIGGYIVNVLGEIPPVGTEIDIDAGYRIRVLESSPRQIENMEFQKRDR
jgi:CBS domain containing-hemolysin-like protein